MSLDGEVRQKTANNTTWKPAQHPGVCYGSPEGGRFCNDDAHWQFIDAPPMHRANWVGAPEIYNLDLAVCSLNEAFGSHCYQVGSSLNRRDYRDVDVRCILPDDEYDQLFPLSTIGVHSQFRDARLIAMNAAFSEWLRKVSGLPVDFQFQRRTEANAEFPGARSALGMHYDIQQYQKREAERAATNALNYPPAPSR
jgi:hypothetical protein